MMWLKTEGDGNGGSDDKAPDECLRRLGERVC